MNVRARIIWGEHDPLGLPSARRLAADLGAPLSIIPGARHFTLEDHPEVVAEIVKELVLEVEGELGTA